MSILKRLLGVETRNTVTTSDPSLAEFLGPRSGVSGYVDNAQASGLAVAQACITVISQNLAAIPLNVYRRGDDGSRERAQDHPLQRVLHDQFTPSMTAFEAREALISDLLTNGNAYAVIETNGRGQVARLFRVSPAMVSIERINNGRLRYRVADHRGQTKVMIQDEILHLRYRIGPDGVLGVSPIQLAREAFGLALTQQEQARKQAAKAFRAEGALVFPQPIPGDKKSEALDKLAARLESQASTSGVIVLDGGAEWHPQSLSSKDAEFLESRKLSNLDVARVFNVPPTAIGIVDNATYSNVEGETRALVTRCLAPMARRIEQAMNAALLTADGRRRHFIEHDMGALLRGDLGARYDAYRVGREAGFLSVNEIRRLENLPPVPGGETHIQPMNFAPLGAQSQEEGN
ncbi:phage portal protein [Sedimentitalea sp. JM2-8]|uniref:Phage portal protein n=1 Tax=Sedimentitalea xiamensis TaxID=3050037 RepID=A0ABT7FJW7_9RHOB|nr:phage portal protein [Sedimentitalea xiamensis]MDK3075451.1 phage portal protein [Sedimentitalea xiamensis]